MPSDKSNPKSTYKYIGFDRLHSEQCRDGVPNDGDDGDVDGGSTGDDGDWARWGVLADRPAKLPTK